MLYLMFMTANRQSYNYRRVIKIENKRAYRTRLEAVHPIESVDPNSRSLCD